MPRLRFAALFFLNLVYSQSPPALHYSKTPTAAATPAKSTVASSLSPTIKTECDSLPNPYTAANGVVFNVTCNEVLLAEENSIGYISVDTERQCLENCSITPACRLINFSERVNRYAEHSCQLLTGYNSSDTVLHSYTYYGIATVISVPPKLSTTRKTASAGLPSGYKTKTPTPTMKTSSISRASSSASMSRPLSTASRPGSVVSSVVSSILPPTSNPTARSCAALGPTYTTSNGDIYDVTCGSYIKLTDDSSNVIFIQSYDSVQQAFETCSGMVNCTILDMDFQDAGTLYFALLKFGNETKEEYGYGYATKRAKLGKRQ